MYYVFIDKSFKGTFRTVSAANHLREFGGNSCYVYKLVCGTLNKLPEFICVNQAIRFADGIKKTLPYNEDPIDVVELANIHQCKWYRAYRSIGFCKERDFNEFR